MTVFGHVGNTCHPSQSQEASCALHSCLRGNIVGLGQSCSLAASRMCRFQSLGYLEPGTAEFPGSSPPLGRSLEEDGLQVRVACNGCGRQRCRSEACCGTVGRQVRVCPRPRARSGQDLAGLRLAIRQRHSPLLKGRFLEFGWELFYSVCLSCFHWAWLTGERAAPWRHALGTLDPEGSDLHEARCPFPWTRAGSPQRGRRGLLSAVRLSRPRGPELPPCLRATAGRRRAQHGGPRAHAHGPRAPAGGGGAGGGG